jgi:1,4-alpha-glucan branching enzyme
VESHDQALVGDQTMIFRLAGASMYSDMHQDCHNAHIDRAIALHKMIRLFTLAGGGEGYLNFMGNEFGHPEWIDFPREGNGWSFHYCRRQWSLQDNPHLKYRFLGEFDRDMVAVTKEVDMFSQHFGNQHMLDDTKKCIAFSRKGLLFAFNFHPSWSQGALRIPVQKGTYFDVAFTSDDWKYGGWGQIPHMTYHAQEDPNNPGEYFIEMHLPCRTCAVLREHFLSEEETATE